MSEATNAAVLAGAAGRQKRKTGVYAAIASAAAGAAAGIATWVATRAPSAAAQQPPPVSAAVAAPASSEQVEQLRKDIGALRVEVQASLRRLDVLERWQAVVEAVQADRERRATTRRER